MPTRSPSSVTPPRRRASTRRPLAPRLGPVGRAYTLISEGQSARSVVDRDRLYRDLLMAADSVAALFALWVAASLMGSDELLWPSLLVVPFTIVASKFLGLYHRDQFRLRKSTLDEAPRIFQLATICALMATIAQSWIVAGPLGGDQVLMALAFLFLGVVLLRGAARRLGRRLTPPERCLVVGGADGREALLTKLRAGHGINVELVNDHPLELDRRHPEDLSRLEETIRSHDVDRVILAPREADSDFTLDAVRLVKSLGVKVSLLPRIFEVVGSSVVFDEVDGTTVLGIRRFGLERSSRYLKRGIDLLGASIGLICIAPVLLVIAIAVKRGSAGPVFFRQIRVGRGGRHFDILKFRTMVDGAEGMKESLLELNEANGLFKIAEDPRITKVGRLLRRTSLDELPQLLNVIRGDMSLVGPRPLVVDEDRQVHGWHRRRLHLTPGMTGPWQVLGSSRIPLQEMVVIDYLYVANWSLFEDVKILVRTVLHMLARGGR